MTKEEMLNEAMRCVKFEVGDDYLQKTIVNEFDDNYFGEGSITLMGNQVDVESIWTDRDNNINIHLSHREFEGDVLLKSLSTDNQITIIDIMRKHYLRLKKEGIEM